MPTHPQHNHTKHEHSAARLEAFSDAIFAIIATITVIDMKDPVGASFSSLLPVLPVLLSFALSFMILVIYWNNHHHLIGHAHEVTPSIMWANAHLLFWLSLTPFVTIWLGEHPLALWPAVLYGVVQFLAAIAYFTLQNVIVCSHGADSELAKTFAKDIKGRASLVLYALAIACAFIVPYISYAIFLIVALMWIVPDKRLKVGE